MKPPELVPFGEAFEIVEGQVDPRELPYLDMLHVGPEDIEGGTGRRIGGATAREKNLISGKYRFRKGQVLYSKIRPYLRKVWLADSDGICSADMYALSAKPDFDVRYLSYFLLSRQFTSQTTAHQSRTGIPKVNRDQLSTCVVPRPSEAEQFSIVRTLDAVSTRFALAKDRVRVLAELKSATATKLFRDGLRSQPLKQTEIGEVPESWSVVDLGSTIDRINYGTSSRCTDGAVGKPVLRIPNVVGGQIDATDLKFAELPATETERYALQDGDLLFVRTNGNRLNTGRCSVYERNPPGALFASYLIRVRLRKEVFDPHFVQAYLSEVGRAQLTGAANAAADGKFNIDTGAIKRVRLPKPTLSEQRQIVHALRSIDHSIAASAATARTLSELFETTLEELMRPS